VSEWQEVSLDSVAQINPTESLSKGTLAKKIAMDALQPFTKRPANFELEPYNGGMKFKNGDTIVARITPCLENGKTAYIDLLDDNEVAYGSTEYIVLREKLGVTDKQFLYYFSISPIFRDVAIASMTGSSGRQRVQTDVVKQHVFEMPPIEEQKAIASVLSSLDDKIDLLHRQNTTLERMAETLFRKWFVEEAQESWEEVSLLDLVDLVGGGTPKTSISEYWDGTIPWLSGGDIATNHKGFVASSEKSITQTGLHNSSAKLLPKFATVISARGTVGKYCLLAESVTFSQSNYGILPKINDCFFFTYLLINHLVEDLQSAAYGSVFDTITTATFRDAKFQNPPKQMVSNFESYISSIFNKKLTNQQQIQTLEKLRDNLLPKLMSGEVRVI
jgi:type I restriction enzyme, S subunit